MSAGKYFIDTNVFIYLFDERAFVKRTKAKAIIGSAVNQGHGVISYQVVQEFLYVTSRKLEKPMTMYERQYWLDTILIPICEVYPSIEFYKNALLIQEEVRCSFYDALIIQGAIQQRCAMLYSEDLQHGRVISGVKIQNPFLT